MFYVSENFYLIKSCWIELKLSGICDEILIENCWDFEQNRAIFNKLPTQDHQKSEGEAKVMRRIILLFYVAANFYIIKSCWIVLQLSGICDEMLIENWWDFEMNWTIFIK